MRSLLNVDFQNTSGQCIHPIASHCLSLLLGGFCAFGLLNDSTCEVANPYPNWFCLIAVFCHVEPPIRVTFEGRD